MVTKKLIRKISNEFNVWLRDAKKYSKLDEAKYGPQTYGADNETTCHDISILNSQTHGCFQQSYKLAWFRTGQGSAKDIEKLIQIFLNQARQFLSKYPSHTVKQTTLFNN